MCSQPNAVRIVRLQAEIVDDEAWYRGLSSGRGFDLLDVGADHHAGERGGGLDLRVAGRDFLASAQDRCGVAQPFHFLQLVADIEDGAAFRLQPIQHDKQLIGFLRRQHRGRLVEDQEFRILHQRPHDLDALALAHRQLPHLALGIERKPVNIGHLLQTRGHVLEEFLAVQPQRHILGDGEIVEQREVLEHHADAARARLGRTGEDHLLALPAHFAVARLDQSIDRLDQRRLPGAVFAKQRVNLLRPDVDVDPVVGEKAAIALGETKGLQQRRERRWEGVGSNIRCHASEGGCLNTVLNCSAK